MENFRSIFDAWKASNPTVDVDLIKVDTAESVLYMIANDTPLELMWTPERTFFAQECSPRFVDLNGFFLASAGRTPPSFERVLDEVKRLAARPLEKSFDYMSLSGSQDYSLGASQDMVMSGNAWHVGDAEKALLAQQVEEAQAVLGEANVRLNDDLACVVLRLRPVDLFTAELGEALSVWEEEPIIVTLSYAGPVVPTVSATQFKNEPSWGVKVLLRSAVEHFATEMRLGAVPLELRPRQSDEKTDAEAVTSVGGKRKKKQQQQQQQQGATGPGWMDSVKDIFNRKQAEKVVFHVDDKLVAAVVELGFSRHEAVTALTRTRNDMDAAVELLVGHEGGHGFNYFLELVAFLSDRFYAMSDYCLACHAPHRCGGDVPIICGRDLCVFFFEEHVGSKIDCRLCPMENCNTQDGIDSSLALCQALKSNGGAFGISLSTLLEMHRHRYLPVAELLKLHEALDKSGYQMTELTSILNPALCARFERKWKEMRAVDKTVAPELCYHGTAEANVPKIMKTGLLVPGKDYGPGIGIIGHATDTGFWGKGIYTSPNAALSIGYCRGGAKLLVNAVVRGKVFKCTNLIHGQPLMAGYDSHEDPSGNEWVIFDECQLLPCYSISIAPKNRV